MFIIKQYIRPYLDQVFQAVHEFWDHEALQPQMLFLIGEIATALRDEFKRYIPALIPRMLAVLSRDGAQRRTGTCIKVLFVCVYVRIKVLCMDVCVCEYVLRRGGAQRGTCIKML